MSEIELKNDEGTTIMKVLDNGDILYFDEETGEEISAKDYFIKIYKEEKDAEDKSGN